MTGNATTTATYVPSRLTIKPGTTVRFINASGGPHNVTFYPDSIPAGAAAALNSPWRSRSEDRDALPNVGADRAAMDYGEPDL